MNLAGNDLVSLDYWMPFGRNHEKCPGKFHHLHESKIKTLFKIHIKSINKKHSHFMTSNYFTTHDNKTLFR